jgi:hypothetical protein
MIDISKYENSDDVPSKDQYPNTPWTHQATLGQKYNLALEIPEGEQESADTYLWMCVGHRLRYDKAEVWQDKRFIGFRPLKWREAFEREREAIAWRAFARDIGAFELYSMVDGARIERTTNRDRVWKMYKARLPERVVGRQDKDILERVHIQREKNAKRRGEVYWRKPVSGEQVEQPQQQQLGLF